MAEYNGLAPVVATAPNVEIRNIVFPPEEAGKKRRLAVAYATRSDGRWAWAKQMPDGSWNFDCYLRAHEIVRVRRVEVLARLKMVCYIEGLGLVDSWELREPIMKIAAEGAKEQ